MLSISKGVQTCAHPRKVCVCVYIFDTSPSESLTWLSGCVVPSVVVVYVVLTRVRSFMSSSNDSPSILGEVMLVLSLLLSLLLICNSPVMIFQCCIVGETN